MMCFLQPIYQAQGEELHINRHKNLKNHVVIILHVPKKIRQRDVS